MEHRLKAFIAEKDVLEQIAQEYSEATVMNLQTPWAMIPLTEDLFDQISEDALSDNINDSVFITEFMEDKLLDVIGDAAMAYVETDYTGSVSFQSAVFWKDGERVFERGSEEIKYQESSAKAINAALHLLGIQPQGAADEFETLELGKYGDLE